MTSRGVNTFLLSGAFLSRTRKDLQSDAMRRTTELISQRSGFNSPWVEKVHQKKPQRLQSSNTSEAVRHFSLWKVSQKETPDIHKNGAKPHWLFPSRGFSFFCKKLKIHSRTWTAQAFALSRLCLGGHQDTLMLFAA